jgi:hypothetical protein
MFMSRAIYVLRGWFIMLSGTPKSLTCRFVGSETWGELSGHYVCGVVLGHIMAGECILCPTVEG